MKITKVEVYKFSIKSRMGIFKWSSGAAAGTDNILVKIRTDEGIVGIAEAPSRPTIYGETQDSLFAAVNKFLGPAILGMDPFDLEKIMDKLDTTLVWNPCAKGAIDIAIHDIIGKASNLPAYKLLGGWNEGKKVPVSWMLGLGSPEEIACQAVEWVQKGFKALKLKAGMDPKKEIEMFRAVRKAVGKDILLYVDANQGWSPHTAIQTIQEMEKEGLAWIEEPVPAWDRKGRELVAKSISVPILGDESVFTPQDVQREIEMGVIRMISIKTPRTGFYKSKKIIQMAEEANIPCLVGSQGETGIGTAASAHFACAFKNIKLPSEISLLLFYEGDLLKEEVRIEGGFVKVPQGTGIGVEIDEEKLKKYSVP